MFQSIGEQTPFFPAIILENSILKGLHHRYGFFVVNNLLIFQKNQSDGGILASADTSVSHCFMRNPYPPLEIKSLIRAN